MSLKFSIVILSFNSRHWLSELLPLIYNSEYKNYEVLLVDNASIDGSVEYVKVNFPDVIIFDFQENIGYARANNTVGNWALDSGSDVVVFLNSDTRVASNWLTVAARAFEYVDRLGIAGPLFQEWMGAGPNAFIQSRYPELHKIEIEDNKHLALDVDWVEGSALFISASCANDVGLFDSIFFMYWEDADLCRRANIKGWRVAILPGCDVMHFGGGNSSKGTSSLKTMKETNEFIYVLVDPRFSIIKNIVRGFRLVLTKIHSPYSGTNVIYRTVICTKALLLCTYRWRDILRKWRRDRYNYKLEGGRKGVLYNK